MAATAWAIAHPVNMLAEALDGRVEGASVNVSPHALDFSYGPVCVLR